MAWSKITTKNQKPIGWWYNKILCEFYYSRNNDKMYYKHLNRMCDKYKINLYGEKYD